MLSEAQLSELQHKQYYLVKVLAKGWHGKWKTVFRTYVLERAQEQMLELGAKGFVVIIIEMPSSTLVDKISGSSGMG